MLIDGANVMKSVKVNKNELLDVVRANKEKHVAEYNEAMEDYKEIVIKIAEKNVKIALKNRLKAKAGNVSGFDKWESLPSQPVSYEAEYSRAIRMLEMSVEVEMEIESAVFNQLALDEWGWENNFNLNAMTYKTMLGGAI